MTAESPPDYEQLLREFREHHGRLRSLVGRPDRGEAPSSADELIREIDEIGERLLVADEELRVQSEELASAQSNLSDVLSAYENLFMDAPIPYVQTDLDGVIVRNNRAAAQLIMASAAGASRTLVGLVRLADRGAVRGLLSHLRTEQIPAPDTGRHGVPPVEVSLQQATGTLPVVLSAQLMLTGMTAPLVHWELRPRPAGAGAPGPAAAQAATVVSMTAAVRDIAALGDLAAMAEAIAAAARALVPGATGTALMLRRARDRVEVAGASDADARMVTDLQRGLHEGPALEVLRAGVAARSDSLSDDRRWPRLAAKQPDLGIRSVLAVPLIGPRGPFGALVCYSAEKAAFDASAQAIAASLATQTALVYSARELEGNLRAGMETRERIGQAVGVLMERHRLTAQQAFDLLVYVSQRTHRKLREIANWVTETGEDPQDFLRGAVGS